MAIGLGWPGRDRDAAWSGNGWHVIDHGANSDQPEAVRPLVPEAFSTANPTEDPWYITGDPIQALDAVRRQIGGKARLVYLDAPRIETNAAKFSASDAGAILNTWLTVVQALLRRSNRLLRSDGVLAVLCGMRELPYVQLLLTELSGARNFVGTAVWQKGYSPRNMENMTELSPTHDNLVFFARRMDALPRVCLRIPPSGYKHDDGDPRGAWKAEQKGANKPDCDYEINIPPYRWRVEGQLPPGIWRINSKSGVMWGEKGAVQTPGDWTFTVEVEDQKGNRASRKFTIRVHEETHAPKPVAPSWLIVERDQNGAILNAPAGDGDLRITTNQLPPAKVGAEYFACLEASGGTPWRGTTRPGKTSTSGKSRYWEFPAKTLRADVARDAVDFKGKADAIPAPKKYLGGEEAEALNQMTTWLVFKNDAYSPGYSQDAKKELEDLRARGVISGFVGFSKPAGLMMRVVALFSDPGDLVVDIGSPAAEFASIATAALRRTAHVEFPEFEPLRETLLVPRLRLAARGRHPLPAAALFTDEAPADRSQEVTGYYVGRRRKPETEDGDVLIMALGEPFARADKRTGTLVIEYGGYPAGQQRFLHGLASIEGLVPLESAVGGLFATTFDKRVLATYLPSDRFLDSRFTARLAEQHADHLNSGGILRVYYHRGSELGESERGGVIQLRRIPFDLQPLAGIL
jgi:hypothetical protein